MHLFIEPEDVWLFRDGRPFDAASNHRARSIFPPYPTVLQGAVRSVKLVQEGINLEDRQAITKVVGSSQDYGKLRMRGPFLAKNESGNLTRYFPRPVDWFPADEKSEMIRALVPVEKPAELKTSTHSDERKRDDNHLPLLLFPGDFQPGKREYGDWLAESELNEYLLGKPVTPISSSELFVRESRVGIKLQTRSRAVERGMLYEAEFIRPCQNVGLALEVEGYENWKDSGLMRLGGEGRAARYHRVDAKPWPAPPVPLPQRFKIYYASPAYFSNGWHPGNWNSFFDGDVTLEAVALRGYETSGGFDYITHGDKPSRRYIPAGSVYFFSSDGQARLDSGLIQNAITETGAEIGFGQIRIAEW
jgi:CRISPR-associated protein Cmr3